MEQLLGKKIKIVLVDNDLPIHTPFLMNKYIRMNEAFCLSIIHDGEVVGKQFAQISTKNRFMQLIGALCFIITSPRKALSLFNANIHRGAKKAAVRFFLDWPFLKLNPDIVHFEFGSLAVERVYLKKLITAKFIVSFRGYDINYFGLNKPHIYQDVWHLSDGFHFLGNDLFERAKRRGYDGSKLNYFISPAIDVELFQPRRITHQGDKIRIVSNGRLVWKKGYEYALKAFQMLLKDGYNIHYTIIGEGNYREAILFMIHQLGLPEHVTLLGRVGQDKVVSILNESDIFLHPAVSEGFCNAVVEAQAMELPVVCTDADGLSENIEHGITGYVVPIYDAQAIYIHVKKLLDDRGLMWKFGAAGRKRVLKHFVLANQISAYKQMYLNILK